MGDYLRTTRECAPAGLHPLLAAAIRTHIENYTLGNIEPILMWCETVSTKQKKGLFGGKAEVTLCGMLVTQRWLIWASGKENETPAVLSARLGEIQVQEYEKTDMYKLIRDSGLTISGLRTDGTDTGSSFIGLGPEPAAQKFRTVVKDAVARI